MFSGEYSCVLLLQARTLLCHLSRPHHPHLAPPPETMDATVDYLEEAFSVNNEWDGLASSLTMGPDGRARSAIALWALATDRWLSLIELRSNTGFVGSYVLLTLFIVKWLPPLNGLVLRNSSSARLTTKPWQLR